MARKTMDVEEQKVKFVVAATRQEKPFTALCQEFGISRPTGCLWRKRYQAAGLAGIAERSRRPQCLKPHLHLYRDPQTLRCVLAKSAIHQWSIRASCHPLQHSQPRQDLFPLLLFQHPRLFTSTIPSRLLQNRLSPKADYFRFARDP